MGSESKMPIHPDPLCLTTGPLWSLVSQLNSPKSQCFNIWMGAQDLRCENLDALVDC
jgi:hypothetical protein